MPTRLVGTPLPPRVSASSAISVLPQQSLEASPWRVICRRPVYVRSDADEKQGSPICDLMQGARVRVVEQEARPDGTVRALIVDPVWMGWLTAKTKGGVTNIEPISSPAAEQPDGDIAHGAPAPSEAASAPAAAALPHEAAAAPAAMHDQMPTDSAPSGGVPPSTVSQPATSDDALGTALVIVANGDDGATSRAAVAVDGERAASATVTSLVASQPLDVGGAIDPHVARVLAAASEFETLELPVAPITDLAAVRKIYRRISLTVHPDKNPHPEATAAFRKVFGAFQTLCDAEQQRRLLAELAMRASRAALTRDLAEIQVRPRPGGMGPKERPI